MFELNENSAKILVVDDNPVNMDFLVELLKDYDVRTALDGNSAFEAIREDLPDLILLDITMPEMSGFEFCEQLKTNERTSNIPVIFLTASKDDESILKAFAVGGQDYITKPYRVPEVLVRIKTQLKLKFAMDRLQKLALFDELTGVANRRKFMLDSKRWIAEAKKSAEPFVLCALTIDRFDQINTQYGYSVGDEVIKALVVIIKKSLTGSFAVSRFGGAEFFIIFNGISADQAKLQIDELVSLANKAKFKSLPELKLKLKIGFATSRNDDKKITDVIGRAHQAMSEV